MSMSTVEFYANRAEAAAAAAYDKAEAEGATAEEATAAANAAAIGFVSPLVFHHGINQVPEAPYYLSSSDEEWMPPLDPYTRPDFDYRDEHEEDADINEDADDEKKTDGTDSPFHSSPEQ